MISIELELIREGLPGWRVAPPLQSCPSANPWNLDGTMIAYDSPRAVWASGWRCRGGELGGELDAAACGRQTSVR
jgi:hypothetical protein